MKFLYLGGTIYRKGFDILLSAYMQTFSASDDVCLVVKDMGGDSFYRGQTAKDMILRAKQNPNAPEIIYIDDSMSEEEIASLYRACDVFVSPYRGEGFSLPTLEAMACGLPVVVTKGGATDDFTDEKCAWYLSAEKINIGKTLDGKLFTNEAYLLEPDRDHLCATLKYIFANPTEVYSAGLIASAKARKFWTWRNSTIRLLSRIDYLQGTNLAQVAEKKLPVFADDYIILGLAENEFISGNYENAIGLFTS
ncbi:MAG: glycosyltransferase, partial [Ignavibacteria bacterium]|nr:glycosyltransferase [Ignavibacteria bacterium]